MLFLLFYRIVFFLLLLFYRIVFFLLLFLLFSFLLFFLFFLFVLFFCCSSYFILVIYSFLFIIIFYCWGCPYGVVCGVLPHAPFFIIIVFLLLCGWGLPLRGRFLKIFFNIFLLFLLFSVLIICGRCV